jgi:hypothetical protein
MLEDLERKLSTLSHSDDAIAVIRTFCVGLKGTAERLAVLNATNAILRRPIEHEDVRATGFDDSHDRFVLLQGDVIRTDAAYLYGERIGGHPKYAVLNSSCDLMPNRSPSAMLLCQIRLPELLLAVRVASLSLVGWRIFGSFTRMVFARANPNEVCFRSAIETREAQAT